MNISYVTPYNASDVTQWSGLGYHISRALENAGGKLEYIGNFEKINKLNFIPKKVFHKFFNKLYPTELSISQNRNYSNQIRLKVSPKSDIIFSPGASAIALLKTTIPKVFYSDAVFKSIVHSYHDFKNVSKESIKAGCYLEAQALETSALVIYSSDWAASEAITHYGIKKEKIKVVPFGANFHNNFTHKDIKDIVTGREDNCCNILFMAVDWERKGGNKALAILKELEMIGIKANLHIVGIRNIPVTNLPGNVINHGFISKATPQGRSIIHQILLNSHFLLLPTEMDCTPIVIAEASSYGIPSIINNVGGVKTMVKEHINGKTFSVNDIPSAYAKYIAEIFLDKNKLYNLSYSSFNEFFTRLNWESAGKNILAHLKELI